MLGGDVMTGRGIDQLMPAPVRPELHESYVRDARDYVKLAERLHGAIAQPVPLAYVWGDALAEMQRFAPDLRIVNLETAVTTSATPWPGKGIHYRMSPAHIGCLTAAGLNACTLANNHVLDWGRDGLQDTLAALHDAGIASAGAAADAERAWAPAVLPLAAGARLLLFAWATPDSGVPADWTATAERPGVALLENLDEADAQAVRVCIGWHRRPGDRVVVSLHWGENWVHRVPETQRRFARRLIDLGAADVVHGHSSHHPLPVEVHAGKLILYGCGDLINDYEGITPHGSLRSDLGCLYGVSLARSDGSLQSLEILPFQLRRFRLGPVEPDGLRWLEDQLNSGGRTLGTHFEARADGHLHMRPPGTTPRAPAGSPPPIERPQR